MRALWLQRHIAEMKLLIAAISYFAGISDSVAGSLDSFTTQCSQG